jgi:hypothetical protein
LPWIDAGIVEFIRTPADFDRRLNFDAMMRAEQLRTVPEIQAAIAATTEDLHSRHFKSQALHLALLSMPDSQIKRIFRELDLSSDKFTEADFIVYINSLRENNPDFLEPLGDGSNAEQLHIIFSGGTYEMAQLSAQIARSYLFTDLRAKWAMIEHDGEHHGAENRVWAPFAKAVQNTKLHYLNNLRLDHALMLRKENRLDGVRSLLTRVWERARSDEPFDEQSAIHLANNLTVAVDEAEAEWRQIQKDIVKYGGGGLAAGTVPAGAAIASGHALWVAAATIIGTATMAVWSKIQKRAYLKKHPAAFFMDLRAE